MRCGRSLVLTLLLACGDEHVAEPDDLDAGAMMTARDAMRDAPAANLDAKTVVDARTSDAAMQRDALEVEVATGMLRGKLSGQTRVFLGIPYAAPPLGNLRYALPQPAAGWSEPRDATQYGAACPQPSDATGALGPKSEDCLFVNVAAPMSASKAPVMVFLHGGGLHIGAGSDYPLENLSARSEAVVVTVNYRLGALGFLTRPELDRELGTTSGNMGLRDQQLALRWVKDNIARFGGDPDNVTLFGESAGGISTCLHMFMTGSAGLANRYLMESGTCAVGALAPLDKSKVGALSDELVTSLVTDGVRGASRGAAGFEERTERTSCS